MTPWVDPAPSSSPHPVFSPCSDTVGLCLGSKWHACSEVTQIIPSLRILYSCHSHLADNPGHVGVPQPLLKPRPWATGRGYMGRGPKWRWSSTLQAWKELEIWQKSTKNLWIMAKKGRGNIYSLSSTTWRPPNEARFKISKKRSLFMQREMNAWPSLPQDDYGPYGGFKKRLDH